MRLLSEIREEILKYNCLSKFRFLNHGEPLVSRAETELFYSSPCEEESWGGVLTSNPHVKFCSDNFIASNTPPSLPLGRGRSKAVPGFAWHPLPLRRFPNYQRIPYIHYRFAHRLSLDLIRQHPRRADTYAPFIHAHRGDRRAVMRRKVQVSKSHDRHILRYPQPLCFRFHDNALCQRVGAANDRVETFVPRHHLPQRATPDFHIRRTRHHQLFDLMLRTPA